MTHLVDIGLAATLVAPMVWPVRRREFLLSWRKVGGLYHWRVGRLGGSFYIAKR